MSCVGFGFALLSVELALAATLICSVDLVGMVLLSPGCSLVTVAGTCVGLQGFCFWASGVASSAE